MQLHTMSTATNDNSSTTYSCAEGLVKAKFDSEEVLLTLPGDRTITLKQQPSGSGIRYEGEGVEFIGKGSDASISENGSPLYTNCISGTIQGNGMTGDSNNGMKTFIDSGKTFEFMYPGTFTLTGAGVGYTTDWMNQSTDNGLILARVTIPKSFQSNTNFSEARFTVGTSADPKAVKQCSTEGVPATIHGVTFKKISTADAGAGNFYETTSYRTIRNNQCYVVEYTIHSTNIGNYPPELGITEFDKATVQSALEAMVQSFAFL
ncbi:MAG: hypothetical protein AB203_02875 [Parcubacteria bacterium C7867-008]|nr:MAG: hypothetical protein AB203_02875 [Parcubacteria bacterium C7867-008]